MPRAGLGAGVCERRTAAALTDSFVKVRALPSLAREEQHTVGHSVRVSGVLSTEQGAERGAQGRLSDGEGRAHTSPGEEPPASLAPTEALSGAGLGVLPGPELDELDERGSCGAPSCCRQGRVTPGPGGSRVTGSE